MNSAVALRDPAVRPSDVLRGVFGLPSFRGIQEQAIEALLGGRDVLALMPTGGGKSLCYQVPAVLGRGTALVVSPLVALMRDQVAKLRDAGVGAAALLGAQAQDASERSEVLAAFREGRLDILYVSPERLLSPGFAGALGSVELSFVAIDEAHCVCSWGHDFRSDYLRIPEALAGVPRTPRIALTASASRAAQGEIAARLLDDPVEFSGGFDRPNLRLRVAKQALEASAAADRALAMIAARKGAVLVYCPTRAMTASVAEALGRLGAASANYHAGMEASERAAVEEDFRAGRLDAVAATSAFGMGIDRSDVVGVIHLGLPTSLEAYYQEAGRAGRDGGPAEAVLLWSDKDAGSRWGRVASETDPDVATRLAGRLESVLAYVETAGCRRNALLAKFGDRFRSGCGRCDRCEDPPRTREAAREVDAALGLLARFGPMGPSVLASALAGVAGVDAPVGIDAASGFGCVQDGVKAARHLVREFVAHGVADVDERTGKVVPVSSSGAAPAVAVEDRSGKSDRSRTGEGLPEWRLQVWRDLVGLRKARALAAGCEPERIAEDASLAQAVARAGEGDFGWPEGTDAEFARGAAGVLEASDRLGSGPEAFDTELF